MIKGKTENTSFLCVHSTDTKFICDLIDWLNNYKGVEPNSTMIRLNDMDPYEELDLRMGQIEGMTQRIRNLEKEIEVSKDLYNNPL